MGRMMSEILEDEIKVSAIIPVYNAETSIMRAVQSALNQTVKPYEIIVVDDGSTDNSVKVLAEYKEDLVIIKQRNRGQGAARNVGLDVASGEYVAFLDADDYWLPDFLETCLEFMNIHPDAIAVSTGFLKKNKRGQTIGPSCLEDFSCSHSQGIILDNFFDFWAEYDHVRTGTVLLRKNVIEKAGLQRADLRISQDLEYWGYLATYGKWGFIPKVSWVGDSVRVASRSGWRKKYSIRRKLCPEVEAWEERILPRLKGSQMHGYRIIRGRIAIGYAHNKILGGNYNSAYRIYSKYKHEMPRTRITKLMGFGTKFGKIGWITISQLLRIREFIKG